jgi:hypothetical protein
LLAPGDTIVIDGTGDTNANLGGLGPFGGNHTMVLGGANHGSYIIDMGTSGETQITLEGSGHQQISAGFGTAETFIMGATQTGAQTAGTSISNLENNGGGAGDSIDVGSANNLTTAEGSAGAVVAAGEYFTSATQLTWFDAGHSAVDTVAITLAGPSSLVLQADHHTFKVV